MKKNVRITLAIEVETREDEHIKDQIATDVIEALGTIPYVNPATPLVFRVDIFEPTNK